MVLLVTVQDKKALVGAQNMLGLLRGLREHRDVQHPARFAEDEPTEKLSQQEIKEKLTGLGVNAEEILGLAGIDDTVPNLVRLAHVAILEANDHGDENQGTSSGRKDPPPSVDEAPPSKRTKIVQVAIKFFLCCI